MFAHSFLQLYELELIGMRSLLQNLQRLLVGFKIFFSSRNLRTKSGEFPAGGIGAGAVADHPEYLFLTMLRNSDAPRSI